MKLHIGIAGPVSTESIAPFLAGDTAALPVGHSGAPLLGTLIGELLSRGHVKSTYSTFPNAPLNLHQLMPAHDVRFKICDRPQCKHAGRINAGYLSRIPNIFRLTRLYLPQSSCRVSSDVVNASNWTYAVDRAAVGSDKSLLETTHDASQAGLNFMPNIYRQIIVGDNQAKQLNAT